MPTHEVEGVGTHEAPRGTLSHWIVIKDTKIKNYGVKYYWETLIHELTHVWQGHNSAFPVGYIFSRRRFFA